MEIIQSFSSPEKALSFARHLNMDNIIIETTSTIKSIGYTKAIPRKGRYHVVSLKSLGFNDRRKIEKIKEEVGSS